MLDQRNAAGKRGAAARTTSPQRLEHHSVASSVIWPLVNIAMQPDVKIGSQIMLLDCTGVPPFAGTGTNAAVKLPTGEIFPEKAATECILRVVVPTNPMKTACWFTGFPVDGGHGCTGA